MSSPKDAKQAVSCRHGKDTGSCVSAALVPAGGEREPYLFTPSLELTFRGHRSTVLAASFRPMALSHSQPLRGNRSSSQREANTPCILSGGADGCVFLWSACSDVRASRFVGHRGPVRDCVWSSRAQLIASAGHDGFVRLWLPSLRRSSSVVRSTSFRGASFGSGEDNCYCWRAHAGPVRAVAAAPDDDYLYTAGDDKAVKCWDLNYVPSRVSSTGMSGGHKFVCGFVGGHQNWVRTVAVSSGRGFLPSHVSLVASGGDDRTVQVWDPRSRRPSHSFYEHTDCVRSVDFHPDGCSIATGSSDHTINVYDLRGNRLLQHYSAHDGAVNEVRFAPTGSWLISASADGTAKLWDLKEGCLYCTLSAHKGGVYTSRFSDDGRHLVTGGHDGLVMMWRSGLLQVQPTCSSYTGMEKYPLLGANMQCLQSECSASVGSKPHSADGCRIKGTAVATFVDVNGGPRSSAVGTKATDASPVGSRHGCCTEPSGSGDSRRAVCPKAKVTDPQSEKPIGFFVTSSHNSLVSSQRPPLPRPSPQVISGETMGAGAKVVAGPDDCPHSTYVRDDPGEGVETRVHRAGTAARLERGCTGGKPGFNPRNGGAVSAPMRGENQVEDVDMFLDSCLAQDERRNKVIEQRCRQQQRNQSCPNGTCMSSTAGAGSNVREEVVWLDEDGEEEVSVVEYTDDVPGVEHGNGFSNQASATQCPFGRMEVSNKEDTCTIDGRVARLEKAYAQLVEEVQLSRKQTANVLHKQQESWELHKQQQRTEIEQLRVMMEGLVSQQDALLEALRKVR
uniref:Uncharacterized protein n=1 Tax=Trypanosoma congolense (strain IL3000) TaxID=1068625 RepID=G0UVS1_TRYCI|nr:conserved hypothetical protein [Trypanosoma congolense IL3000]